MSANIDGFAFFGTEVLLGGSIGLEEEEPLSFFFDSDFFPEDDLASDSGVKGRGDLDELFEELLELECLLPFSFSFSLTFSFKLPFPAPPEEEDTEVEDGGGAVDCRLIGVPNKFSKEFLGEDFAVPAAGLDLPPPEW